MRLSGDVYGGLNAAKHFALFCLVGFKCSHDDFPALGNFLPAMGQDFFTDDFCYEKAHGLIRHFILWKKGRGIRQLVDNPLQEMVEVKTMQCADGVDFSAWD